MRKNSDNDHAHDTDGPEDEDAYRRGFQQGSEFAFRAIEGGASSMLLAKWRKAIYRWCFDVTHKKRHSPPVIYAGKIIEPGKLSRRSRKPTPTASSDAE
jgi:hypothetical protein